MIRVFGPNTTDFTSLGDYQVVVNSAEIKKTEDEYTLEIDVLEEYRDCFVQDYIVAVDTVKGCMAFRLNNVENKDKLSSKAICISAPYTKTITQELIEGVNLLDVEISENWDDVVTVLMAKYDDEVIGTYYSECSYSRDYRKEVDFDLTDKIRERVEEVKEKLEEETKTKNSLEAAISNLDAKKKEYTETTKIMEQDIQEMNRKLQRLGDSEAEEQERLRLAAQIPIATDNLEQLRADIQSIPSIKSEYNEKYEESSDRVKDYEDYIANLIRQDISEQAQEYIKENQEPKINYRLDTILSEPVNISDTIYIKSDKVIGEKRIVSYTYDCLNNQYTEIEVEALRTTLKARLEEMKDSIEEKANKKDIKKAVAFYSSEYIRTEKEMMSKFYAEIYSVETGLIKKQESIISQTAGRIATSVKETLQSYSTTQEMRSEIEQTAKSISATVTNTLKSYSTTQEMRAAITETAESIELSVSNKLQNYSTTQEMNSSISQTAESITLTVSEKLKSYSTTSEMKSAISQTASSITSTVNTKFKNYSTTTEMNSSIKQTASSIKSEVTEKVNGLTQSISVVEQTANKISWLVKSGSSSSNFELTDRAISLVSKKIDLTGYVTFSSLSTKGQTTINGENIRTGNIDASVVGVIKINADNITSGSIDASKITVKNLTAKCFSSDAIDANLISCGGRGAFYTGNSNTLTIGGSYYTYVNNVDVAATTFKTTGTNAYLSAEIAVLGKSGGQVGFFGSSGNKRQTVNKVATTATLAVLIGRFNSLLTALANYNLIYTS